MLNKPSNKEIIDFYEEGHVYINRGTRKKYTSVTTLIHKYEPEFDLEFWSLYKAIERLLNKEYPMAWSKVKNGIRDNGREWLFVYIGNNTIYPKEVFVKVQNELKAEWLDSNLNALERGSKYHSRQELRALYNQYSFMQGENRPLANPTASLYKGEKRPRLCSELPDGQYVELLLHNHEHEVAGQTDRCFIETINGKRYIDIDDYKTNKTLLFKNRYETLKAPLQHLDNCNGSIYKLQLSFYAWLAKQYGFIPRRLTITHVTGTIREFPIFFLEKEINDIINLRKKELKIL